MAANPETVIITGASSGMGLACVSTFARRGCRIVCLGRDPERTKQAVSEAERAGAHSALGFEVDFTDLDAIPRFFSDATETLGTVDYVVNSAGIAELGAVAELSEEAWERVFRVNVTAAFSMIKHALPHLLKSDRASVVNVSSVAGRLRSISLGAHYSASMAALIGMTRHLAGELGPQGVRINATCPSQTETPMLMRALSPEGRAALAKTVPLRRLATAPEQADVISFLCSPQSSYVNGTILDVNGGIL